MPTITTRKNSLFNLTALQAYRADGASVCLLLRHCGIYILQAYRWTEAFGHGENGFREEIMFSTTAIKFLLTGENTYLGQSRKLVKLFTTFLSFGLL